MSNADILRRTILVCLLAGLFPGMLSAAEDVILGDFEGGSFSGWQAEGEAFGSGPATGNVGRQKGVKGFTGKGMANSFHGDDAAAGRLTSPFFIIDRPYIRFVIGGGNHPGETCLDLVIDGKTVRSATGQSDPELRPGGWDVGEFRGLTARIVARDSFAVDWGWIAVDDIVATDTPPPPPQTVPGKAAPGKGAARGGPQAAKDLIQFQTGADFTVTHFADSSLVHNPIALTTDESGAVYVAEVGREMRGVEDTRQKSFWMMDELANQSIEDRLQQYQKWIAQGKFESDHFTRYEDRIIKLVDSDGDGKADKRTIYADGFNDPLDGNGASVLFDHGKVYYTNIPNLWLLEDADGDGKAEKRRSLQRGFGLRSGVSGHDMHGLEWGPDGRLYWSIGDRAYNFVTREGKTLKDAESGAVFRCEPDGSHIERFCFGNRNPQDLAFDQYGNLFTVDNNRGAGDRSRVCYLVEGGDYGWNSGYENLSTFARPSGVADLPGPAVPVAWTEEGLWKQYFPGQPAHVIPAVDFIDGGSCGLTFVPGASLGAAYDDHFLFSAYQRGIKSFAMQERGAGFAMADYTDFWQGGFIIDTEFTPAGDVLIADYVSTATAEKGDIYQLRNPTLANTAMVTGPASALAGSFEEKTAAQLFELLASRDQRVRLRAQFALAAAGPEGRAMLTRAAVEPAPLSLRPEPKDAAAPIAPAHITTHRTEGGWEELALGAPAGNDYADQASGHGVEIIYVARPALAVPHVKAGAKGAVLPRLNDGIAAANDDDIGRCTWLDLKASRLLMDLKGEVEVAQVNTYTWHKADRAPQRYTLYGSVEAKPDPMNNRDWQELARVDSRPWGEGGKHGSAVRRDDSSLGTFRFLMWVTPGVPVGPFFTELDVYAAGQHPSEVAAVTPPGGAVLPPEPWEPEVFNGPLLRRLHGIWGLGQIGRRDPAAVVPTLVGLLQDPFYRIRAQAARTLGDIADPTAGSALRALLADENARVRGFAATAIGRCGSSDAIPALLQVIRETGDTDPILRHQLTYGLACLDAVDALLAAADDSSPAVRLAILQVLRRAGDPRIARFLNDPDPTIVAESMRAIYDRRIDAAEPELAAKLADFIHAPAGTVLPSQLNLERMISANIRLGRQEQLERLAAAAADPGLPERARESILYQLGRWDTPSPVDQIIGQLRPIPADRIDPKVGITTLVLAMLPEAKGPVRTALYFLASAWKVPMMQSQLEEQVKNAGAAGPERLQALAALLQQPGDHTNLLGTLVLDADQAVRIAALQALAERDAAAALAAAEKLLPAGTAADRQAVYGILGKMDDDRSAALLLADINQLIAGNGSTEAALELIDACSQRHEPALKAALERYTASLAQQDPLSGYRVLLAGGDAVRGEQLVRSHGTAQCLVCHNLNGDGGIVAPDLTQIGKRAQSEYILESLVLPGAKVVAGFGIMTVVMKDGTTVAGALVEETPTALTIKLPDGSSQAVAIDKVATRTDAISSMPPMTAMLQKHEIRDIVAYLVNLNAPKGAKAAH